MAFVSIVKPTTAFSTIAKPSATWLESGDLGANILLENEAILLLEDSWKIKIAENVWSIIERPI